MKGLWRLRKYRGSIYHMTQWLELFCRAQNHLLANFWLLSSVLPGLRVQGLVYVTVSGFWFRLARLGVHGLAGLRISWLCAIPDFRFS